LRLKKSLGQHFLKSRTVLRRIVEVAKLQRESRVIEIGAGSGALTKEILAKNPLELVVVEIDSRWVEFLREKFKDKVKILQADATKFDFSSLNKTYIYIGNLPYNAATAILRNIITHRKTVERGIFMVQKEVAIRLSSKIGKNYGYFSALISTFFDVKLLFDVHPSAFYPQPKVTSTVFELTPAGFDMPEEELLSFEKFLKTVFSHRRKKLRSNLRLSVTGAVFEIRAEELPPERLLELYRELREKGYLCLTT